MHRSDHCVKELCIKVDARRTDKSLEVSAGIVCSVASLYWFLLVDEGFLLVDNKGMDSRVLVKKK